MLFLLPGHKNNVEGEKKGLEKKEKSGVNFSFHVLLQTKQKKNENWELSVEKEHSLKVFVIKKVYLSFFWISEDEFLKNIEIVVLSVKGSFVWAFEVLRQTMKFLEKER